MTDTKETIDSEIKETPKEQVSKFNAGIAMLERIDEIKKNITKTYLSRDYGAWADLLSNYCTEIFERMSETEKKDVGNFEKRIEKHIREETIHLNEELLHAFYRYLNGVAKRAGLSMPDKDVKDPGRAMLN